MNIFLACPAAVGSRHGNRVTAERWARILKELGHRVTIGFRYEDAPCDLLVALHARKSYPALARYRRIQPQGPLFVALTGTDLYRDPRTSRHAQRSLEMADRLIVLQPRAKDELAPHLRRKVRLIYQSAEPTPRPPAKILGCFEVCVIGHLRSVKDPFRAVQALRLLPADSTLRVLHAGKAMSQGMKRRARAWMAREPRYHWLGELSRPLSRRLLARTRVLVLASLMEGGANVISEAVVDGVPVLASRIAGSVGLLGARYPGFFPVGETAALARLLHRVATEPAFLERLKDACDRLRPLFEPVRERESWQRLLAEIGGLHFSSRRR